MDKVTEPLLLLAICETRAGNFKLSSGDGVQGVAGASGVVSVPEASAGLVHECSGGIDVGSDKMPVALDDVTSHDHGLYIGWSRVEQHDRDWVFESV